ncbi:MAG: ABC transporter permease [Acidobacteriota bacterium]|jgi:lipopolysaccharide transport system permease protein
MIQETITAKNRSAEAHLAAAGAAMDAPVLVIEPKHGWLPIDFTELWHYRELLYFFVWRDVKVRYKQTVLGAAWAIIQPVVSMVIFSVIFGKLARLPSDDVPYPIFVYAGLLPWTFFANAVASSGVSLISEAGLLTKIYFPRLYIPMAGIGAGLVDFAFSLAVYAGIMVYYRQFPGPPGFLLPVLILLTMVTAAGMGFILSSITIAYRDFKHVIPFMIQVWMYGSPVVYPATLIPEKYRLLVAINPMAGIIGGFRSVLLNRPMDWKSLGISTTVAAGLFVFGLYNFRRTERRFADIA